MSSDGPSAEKHGVAAMIGLFETTARFGGRTAAGRPSGSGRGDVTGRAGAASGGHAPGTPSDATVGAAGHVGRTIARFGGRAAAGRQRTSHGDVATGARGVDGADVDAAVSVGRLIARFGGRTAAAAGRPSGTGRGRGGAVTDRADAAVVATAGGVGRSVTRSDGRTAASGGHATPVPAVADVDAVVSVGRWNARFGRRAAAAAAKRHCVGIGDVTGRPGAARCGHAAPVPAGPRVVDAWQTADGATGAVSSDRSSERETTAASIGGGGGGGGDDGVARRRRLWLQRRERERSAWSDGHEVAPVGSTEPFIANSTRFDDKTMIEPSENVQQKIAFIFNNMNQENVKKKCAEVKKNLKHIYFPWFSVFFMKRICDVPQLHSLYSKFLEYFDRSSLKKLILLETERNIKVLLMKDDKSPQTKTSLKNLGHWLGLITLAKNKRPPFDFEKMVIDAFYKNDDQLSYILPFVTKTLESCKLSSVYSTHSRWNMQLMDCLAELHPTLRFVFTTYNLQRDIDLLFNILNVKLESYAGYTMFNVRVNYFNIEMNEDHILVPCRQSTKKH